MEKLFNQIKNINWPDKKTILSDTRIVLFGSIFFMLVISGIEYLGLLIMKGF